MRKNIVAGNWKMNLTLSESVSLIKELKTKINADSLPNTRVIVAPTFVNLYAATEAVEDTIIEVAAQNMHFEDNGAFTGEISGKMLQEIDVNSVIIGHSERRTYFGETDEILKKKVEKAIANNQEVIFCFGEQLEERKDGKHFEVVASQIEKALFELDAENWKNIVLAYEPVWAIGTGETASPEQAQEIHAYVRKFIAENYSSELAETISILYGGSVKPGNAKEIFSKPDVDGGLIGGAALKADDFTAIVNATI
ncbi:triose-phosphate isomerase [Aureivirga sp. CE67]|uniref:triose-phosphate isomerase n=1 Tax=Aureivirga sp. CE67 TaxID=1788983 RepID=UPI0018CAD2F5|nr:triose-phosphate isomerase [Aureivirga sp. CE67]